MAIEIHIFSSIDWILYRFYNKHLQSKKILYLSNKQHTRRTQKDYFYLSDDLFFSIFVHFWCVFYLLSPSIVLHKSVVGFINNFDILTPSKTNYNFIAILSIVVDNVVAHALMHFDTSATKDPYPVGLWCVNKPKPKHWSMKSLILYKSEYKITI